MSSLVAFQSSQHLDLSQVLSQPLEIALLVLEWSQLPVPVPSDYERWGAAPVDLDRCLIYYAAADLHDLTWRTEQGHEVIGGPIARRVARVRRRLRKAGLLHA
ncbi:MAG: hypothetical protein M3072_17105 [Candidatus Dormibacteraeota bacterium]|nr:hypothetical protein [Candidatus Dormibacteraeota bacterium]